MKIISRAQVEQIHTYLIGRFGGLAGIRDEGMLESALDAHSKPSIRILFIQIR